MLQSFLWHTYNMVQENLMKGRVRQTNLRSSRPIKSIDKNVKVNRALWELAEGMKKIKQGGILEFA